VRFRALGAAVAVVLAVAGLAGCRTNVGTAAWVDGHRITDSDVKELVTPTGIDPSLAAQAAAQHQQIQPPKSQVLTFLIQEAVYEDTLAAENVKYTEGKLTSVHDAAISEFFQGTLSGTAFENKLAQRLPKFGIDSSFIAKLVRVAELKYLLHVNNQNTPLNTLIERAKISVTVSPRYGTWEPKSLAVNPKAPVPGYLSVQPGGPAG
jgi:hypothetical protein